MRIHLVFVGLALSGVACREHNPAYLGKADAQAQLDALDDALVAGDLADAGPTDAISDGAPSPDANMDVPDSQPGDTRDARDLRKNDDTSAGDAARDGSLPPDLVPPTDGPVDLPIGLDQAQLDEGGVDVAACAESATRSCSTPGNPLVGACQSGMQTCTGGAWGECVGEVLPASAEICGNGIDDNCNGMVDEGCASDCVIVAPIGSDAGGAADGTAANPFLSVQEAIDYARAQDGGSPARVCVAGGSSCSDTATYTLDASLSVPNGMRIQGNYALPDTGLIYCSSTLPPTTTLKFTASNQGVVFDSSVQSSTELSGFAIERHSPGVAATTTQTVSAVQVNGQNVSLSDIFVTDAPSADNTYGVDIETGGQVTIVGSSIGGGAGRSQAVGVFVNGGSVKLINNCTTLGRGICASACSDSSDVLGIRGRSGPTTSATGANADTSAVFVTSSSSAFSTITGNMLCGSAGVTTSGSLAGNVATLRCESDGCASVSDNTISGGTGRLALAVYVTNGRSLFDGNTIAAGCGTESSTAVLIDGASARLQNNRVFGSSCGDANSNAGFTGVRILGGVAGGEADLNSNDIDPLGLDGACQSIGVAIDRTSGAAVAAGLLRNNIVAAGICQTRFAVSEVGAGLARVIDNNDLYSRADDKVGTSILYHRGTNNLSTIASVNALFGVSNNISADPQFVSYPTDLRLDSSSPCIDQGIATGAPATDADGNARPSGAGYDIGAYEFTP